MKQRASVSFAKPILDRSCCGRSRVVRSNGTRSEHHAPFELEQGYVWQSVSVSTRIPERDASHVPLVATQSISGSRWTSRNAHGIRRSNATKKRSIFPSFRVRRTVDGILSPLRADSEVSCLEELHRSEEETVWSMQVASKDLKAIWKLRSRTQGEGSSSWEIVLDLAVRSPIDAYGAKRVLEEDAKRIVDRLARKAAESSEKSAGPSAPFFTSYAWREPPDPLQKRSVNEWQQAKDEDWWEEGNARDVQVHLRRLDDATHLHRRAVASVKIRSGRAQAWNVLSDVQSWCEFVPGLVRSCPIDASTCTSRSGERRYAMEQTYRSHDMAGPMEAKLRLDILEKDGRELQFRAASCRPANGDPRQVQGKWLLQQEGTGGKGCEVLLKFAIEARVSRPEGSGLPSHLAPHGPLAEKVVYEDLPAMLLSFRDRIEELARMSNREGSRPSLLEMKENVEILEKELRRTFGKDAPLPSRSLLRQAGRTDLEKAISHHGGAAEVARVTGMEISYVPRKPKGHWDCLDNMREEIQGFQWAHALDPNVMPTRAEFQRRGRKDIARALERWGGGPALAGLLGMASPTRATSPWDLHLRQVACSTGARGTELFRIASKSYRNGLGGGERSKEPGCDETEEDLLSENTAYSTHE